MDPGSGADVEKLCKSRPDEESNKNHPPIIESLTNSSSAHSSMSHSISSHSSGSNSVAKPLSSIKLDEVLSNVTLNFDKINTAICLSPNITSIKFSTFRSLLVGTNSDDVQSELLELFLQKIKDMNAEYLEFIIEKLHSDENKINFCAKYKEYLLTHIKRFDPKKISEKIIRKSVRNQFNEMFNLPLEIIQDRGDGFEVFGAFIKIPDMTDGETLTIQNPTDINHTVKLTKYARGNVHIENKSTTGYRSTSMKFSGVWIIDQHGLRME